MKLLIADDDPIILDLLVEIFVAYGFEDIVLTSNGAEALRAIEKSPQRFDFLLLDVQMPVLDGIELCRQVRALPGYAKTPIIMITAMTDKTYIESAFVAGATDYTTKPFDVRALIAQVRRAEQPATVLPTTGKVPAPVARTFGDPKILNRKISGFVDRQALLNYARVVQAQGAFSAIAVAIKVGVLRDLFDRLPPADFETALGDVAEILFESLIGTQAVVSYLGDGQFLCLCDAQRALAPEVLQSELADALRMGDRLWQRGLRREGLVEVHPYETLKLRSLAGDPQFADRALQKMKKQYGERSAKLSKLFVMQFSKPPLTPATPTKRRGLWQRIQTPKTSCGKGGLAKRQSP
ncbi:response regulator [Sulfitobacter sp. JB4-11]|uniref:response regulator n=1 Tax=Sulfitobacter rhodophyticola TaxID=3238304 RepID=UPI003D815582